MAMNISRNNSLGEQSLHIVYAPWEITLCVFLLTFGLTGNAMLLLALWRDPLRCFRNITAYFIQNIAVVDGLGLIVSYAILITAVKTHSPVYVGSNHMRQFKPFMVFLTVLTNLSLTSFAVERFVSITKPFFHNIYFTKERVRLGFVVMLIFGLVCVAIDQGIYRLVQEVPISSYVVEILVFLICLTATFSLYFACFVSIKRQQRRFKRSNMTDVTGKAFKMKLLNERRFLVTITIISCMTVLFWAPAFIVLLPFRIQGDKELHKQFLTVLPCFAAVHGSINPVVYLLRLPNYKKTFYKLYCCFHAQTASTVN